jgi:hypothetical protein
MEKILVGVLLFVLVALAGEVMHSRALDWLERRAVGNAWEGCMSAARMSSPSWLGDRALRREADVLFRKLKLDRRERGLKPFLPSHLVGIPAADLIRRYA